jgi:hypothetical protein
MNLLVDGPIPSETSHSSTEDIATTGEQVCSEIYCTRCGRARQTKPSKIGGVKLPLGWKRAGDDAVCAECWNKTHLLRALTFAVAEPLSGSWKEFETDLKHMWLQATAASNWMITECYARDVRRNGEAKMPPMPRIYLYPEARAKFPGLPPQTIVSLEHAVQRQYRAKRYEVIWNCAASLPSYRYPQPFPQHNQMWSFEFNAQGQPVVSVRIGEKRWELRLKGGARYARQTAGLKKLAQRGELAIYKSHDGTILCKLVGWLDRPAAARGMAGTLHVRTAADRLLVAVDEKDECIWSENCDHLKRWIAEHKGRLKRLAEDQKAEQRPEPSFAQRRTLAVQKQHRRVKSAIQEVAAHVANFAARRKFAAVVYDDSSRGFMGEEFPYFQLAERLRVNLDERGIEFEYRARALADEKRPALIVAERTYENNLLATVTPSARDAHHACHAMRSRKAV